ncbi:MAG TPA: cytochrome b/b6 domain-containing protein [Terriglobales bacterium]|nr:cytochrome b/b6 domain-containing protein [Terriglobales bacterium]
MGALGSTQAAAAASSRSDVSAAPIAKVTLRHSALVRVTHWITVVSFFALLITGCEIVISHPRFYWGETGNVLTTPLFQLPIPSSRKLVPTGYGYVLPDQNGWSRALHFEAAWIVVLTGLLYVIFGVLSKHFRRHLAPSRADLSWRALLTSLAKPLRLKRPDAAEAASYNGLQRLAYLIVIFGLFPLVIWSGLAMSLGFISAFPWAVNLLGGRQSARTIHFFASLALVLFLFVHLFMVCLAGFWSRTAAMITGRIRARKELV